jgi:hypothetical protein
MWKSEDSTEVYIVTSFYKDLFWSYAWLRNVEPRNSEGIRKAKLLGTDSEETLIGFKMAEIVSLHSARKDCCTQ